MDMAIRLLLISRLCNTYLLNDVTSFHLQSLQYQPEALCNQVTMAWRQQLDLLAELSSATCTDQFLLKGTEIEVLFEEVEAELKKENGLKRLLSDDLFLRELFSAASAGLISVCNALKRGALLTPAESSCMVRFFKTISSNILKDGMLYISKPHAAAVLAKGAVPMPPEALQISRMLSVAQGIIKQTGMYTAGVRPLKRPGSMA